MSTQSKKALEKDLIYLSSMLKEGVYENENKLLSLSRLKDLKKIEHVSYFTAKNSLKTIISSNDTQKTDLFFKKYRLGYFYESQKEEVLQMAIDEKSFDVLKVLISNGLHACEFFYEKNLFSDKKPDLDLLSFMLDFDDKYYFGEIMYSVFHTSICKTLNGDSSYLNYINLIYKKLDSDVINKKWWDNYNIQKEIVKTENMENIKPILRFIPDDISWDVDELARLNEFGFSMSDYINFLNVCSAIPSLNKALDIFFKEEEKKLVHFKNEVSEKTKEVQQDKFFISGYLKSDHALRLNMLNPPSFIKDFIMLTQNNLLDYPPLNIYESFILSSNESILFLNNKKGKEKIIDAFSKDEFMFKWLCNTHIDVVSELFSKISEMDNWRDENNNTLGHYIVCCSLLANDLYDDEKISSFLSLIEKKSNWFTSENNDNNTALDIFKSIITHNDIKKDFSSVFSTISKNNLISATKKIKNRATPPRKKIF